MDAYCKARNVLVIGRVALRQLAGENVGFDDGMPALKQAAFNTNGGCLCPTQAMLISRPSMW